MGLGSEMNVDVVLPVRRRNDFHQGVAPHQDGTLSLGVLASERQVVLPTLAQKHQTQLAELAGGDEALWFVVDRR